MGGRGEEAEEEVEITLKIIGPTRPSPLRLPSRIQVRELRKRIAADRELPVEHLKLVLKGQVLHDIKNGDEVYHRLKNGESLIVAVTPKPPAKSIREGYDDDDDDDLEFHIPQSASQWKRKLFSFLHDKLRLPDMLLMAIFSISLKAWAIIVLWFLLAPVAHRWELGPIYILGTGFAILLTNLGQRQQGDTRFDHVIVFGDGHGLGKNLIICLCSAYSIFNDDFRELPGTLNADRLDRDIRAGQF